MYASKRKAGTFLGEWVEAVRPEFIEGERPFKIRCFGKLSITANGQTESELLDSERRFSFAPWLELRARPGSVHYFLRLAML